MSFDFNLESSSPAKQAKQEPLVSEQVKVFCEKTFWEVGHLPSKEKVAEALDLPIEKVQTALSSLKEQFENRGFVTDPDHPTLSGQQILVCNVMLAADRKTEKKKLEELNLEFEERGLPRVTPTKWAAWKRTKPVQEFLHNRAKQMFKADEYKFHQSVLKGVDDGDFQFTKFYGEVSGLYNPKVEVQISVPSIVNQLFEILSRHLPPEQLEVIGLEIEKALTPAPENELAF